MAALETCANRRCNLSGAAAQGNANAQGDVIERTVALIETASARIEANDFTGVEDVCVSQALALDVIFDQFARRSARLDLYDEPMKVALRAQSQCRGTLNTLIALKNPKAMRFSRKQSVENGNSSA
jgi:hypothetical protein